MRLIGHLKSEASARSFGDYLTAMDVRNMVEAEAEGAWAVWVYNEDQIGSGQAALEQYLTNPADPKFSRARDKAAAVLREQSEREKAAEKRVFTRDSIWPQGGIGRLTILLIAASVIATLAGGITGTAVERIHWLFISEYQRPPFLPEVFHGQVWRLITPIFIHFGVLHILFNMMMLRDLGSLIESRQGTGTMALMTVVLALISNLGQYFMAGPMFGGMSGVLYGFFGFIWIRGRVDPRSGLFLTPSSVFIMLLWFVLCWVGVIGSVANWTHTFGLLAGMAWGALPMLGLGRR